ncbi:hypothetical protein, conserved in T. vivax, partial [Trypanosoma vivax Y486]
MAPQYLCVAVLLLATTHAAGETLKCSYKDKAEDAHKCAAVHLLNGWLNVVNRTATRSLEVLRNATLIKDSVVGVRSDAKAVLDNAEKVLGKLHNSSKEAATIQKIIVDVGNAIKWVNDSEANATSAINAANTSEQRARDGYGVASRTAVFLLGDTSETKLEFEVVRDKVNRIINKNHNTCTATRNVSRRLSAYAEQLHNSTLNLSEWKREMLKLLRVTHGELQNDTSTCLAIFTNDKNEKLREVMSAVGNASDKLIVAVEKFDAARLAMKIVKEKITEAQNNVENITTAAHGSLKRNGAVLCDVYKKHGAVMAALDITKQRLEKVNENSVKLLKAVEALQLETTHTSERVQDVANKIKVVSGFSYFPVLGDKKSFDVSRAQATVTKMKAALAAVKKIPREASSNVTSAEQQINDKHRGARDVEEKLKKSFEEVKININDVMENCNAKVENALDKLWKETTGSVVKIDVSELETKSVGLNGLQTENEETNDKIESTNANIQKAFESIKYATNFEKEAAAAASNAVIEVLSEMMSQLCAASAGLRDLRSKSAALSQRAAALKVSVSDEKLRAAAVLVDASGPNELPAHVEDAFAIASRRAAVAEKLLQSSDAKRGNVNTKLGAGMRKSGSEGQGSTIHGRIDELVRNISSGISSNASPDVCETTYITKFMQSLKRSDDEL